MNARISFLLLFFFYHFIPSTFGQEYQLIIIGGGASGTAAGIGAAREGVKTLLIEETPWLGGMLTSAGVSAIDGNHRLPGGIWGEFRSRLEGYYGGPDKLSTGWVSNTLFEPKVGSQILQQMVKEVENLEVSLVSQWISATYSDAVWKVTFSKNGQLRTVSSALLIDATELGDVAASQKLPYRLGMDARSEIGEEFAPEHSNDIIQDLTFVATLQDYGKGTDKTIPKPANYDPSEFACACAHADPITDNAPTLDCDKMLAYGKLPNGKFMINWPNCGNDHYVNLVELNPQDRQIEIEKARQTTLRFVYYIQHELGYSHLGLAEDEYPSADNLPMIPYHRESRRFRGIVDFTLPYLLAPYQTPNPFYRTGIAVGDYTIDHHHKKNPKAPAIDFIKIRVPSYTIPLGALIPQHHPALILAEKSISVSNIVNGATRLQPVVLGIGHAAGLVAVVALEEKKPLSEISIRNVQQKLLNQGSYLMPFLDITPSDPHFQAMQKVGLTGILKGEGVPYLWANQTWFYPDKLVSEYELISGLKAIYPQLKDFWGASGEYLTGARILTLLQMIDKNLSEELIKNIWESNQLPGSFEKEKKLNRKEVSVILDAGLKVFEIEVDWKGNFRK